MSRKHGNPVYHNIIMGLTWFGAVLGCYVNKNTYVICGCAATRGRQGFIILPSLIKNTYANLQFGSFPKFHQATNHYLSQCRSKSLLPYVVTRTQWVDNTCISFFTVSVSKGWCCSALKVNIVLNSSETETNIPAWFSQYHQYRLLLATCTCTISVLRNDVSWRNSHP